MRDAAPISDSWKYSKDGCISATVSLKTLRQFVDSGQLSLEDMAWHSSLGSWCSVKDVEQLIRPMSTDLNDAEPAAKPGVRWRYSKAGALSSYVTHEQVVSLLLHGELDADDQVWSDDLGS